MTREITEKKNPSYMHRTCGSAVSVGYFLSDSLGGGGRGGNRWKKMEKEQNEKNKHVFEYFEVYFSEWSFSPTHVYITHLHMYSGVFHVEKKKRKEKNVYF